MITSQEKGRMNMKKNFIYMTLMLFLLIFCSCESNQTVSLNGMSFEIPEEWNRICEDEKHFECSMQKGDGDIEFIMKVTIDEETILEEKSDDILKKLECTAENDEKLNNLSSMTASLSGMQSQEIIEYEHEVNERKYYYKTVLFEISNGIVEMDFCSLNKTDDKYFDDVIDSIIEN